MIQIGLAVWALIFRQDVHLESRSSVYQSFNAFIDSGQITDQNHVWNRMQGDVSVKFDFSNRCFVTWWSPSSSFAVEMLWRPRNRRFQWVEYPVVVLQPPWAWFGGQAGSLRSRLPGSARGRYQVAVAGHRLLCHRPLLIPSECCRLETRENMWRLLTFWLNLIVFFSFL